LFMLLTLSILTNRKKIVKRYRNPIKTPRSHYLP